MKVRAVLARFYKSFNFDYLRKSHPTATAEAWELLEGEWHPYVRIAVDSLVTTVVGANESGKSHLLSAIEKALIGSGIERSDFCRYSPLFRIRRGEVRLPDLGLEFGELTSDERRTLIELLELGARRPEGFLFLRDGTGEVRVVCSGETFSLSGDQISTLESVFPRAFRIKSEVALPSSISLARLGTKRDRAWIDRESRDSLFNLIFGGSPISVAAVQGQAQEIVDVVTKARSASIAEEQEALAADLLLKVAGIDPSEFDELEHALRSGKDGYANAIVQRVNAELAASLNFPRHWVQDRDFRLIVTPRQYELSLTIRDRTGMEYSFDERSQGLQYFLSYYIQLLAHEAPAEDDRPEILLMDEPDSFLSSDGQRDLLRILEEWVDASNSMHQVLYVTHSPYLINRNHVERIKVLEKGSEDEGTRVVHDAGRNHYEPLRTALGLLAGETVFIGSGNLVVEGVADQVLLVGASRLLKAAGVSQLESLDLNATTIVPAGGADQVTYVVQLARGRDYEKPAVAVLLDSDLEGDKAALELATGGHGGRPMLSSEYVVRIGEISLVPGAGNSPRVRVIEDLVPAQLAALATRRYCTDLLRVNDDELDGVTPDAIETSMNTGVTVFDAAEVALRTVRSDSSLAKVGFARAVVAQVEADPKAVASAQFLANMRPLMRHLVEAVSSAVEAEQQLRVSERFRRRKSAFLKDHRGGAMRDEARMMVQELQRHLAGVRSDEADAIELGLSRLIRDFKLDEDPRAVIEPFEDFRAALDQIAYAPLRAAQVSESGVSGITGNSADPPRRRRRGGRGPQQAGLDSGSSR